MSETEAAAFFSEYMSEKPYRLAWLEHTITQSPGTRKRSRLLPRTSTGVRSPVLDLSVESLVPVWRWFARSHAQLEEAPKEGLPAWYRLPAGGRTSDPRWRRAELWAIDAMAYYYGDLLCEHRHGASWRVGRGAVRRDVNHNLPCVMAPAWIICPLRTISNMARRLVRREPGCDRDDALVDTFRKAINR